MNKNLEILFADSKQERSQKTLEDILQAAEQLVTEADAELFTSRNLAKKSGYGLGTLVRRLNSIDYVFFWAIEKGREKVLKEIGNSISHFDPNLTIQDFVETIVDQGFTAITKVGPKVMRFYDERYTKKNGLTTDYFDHFDLLVEPYLEACQKNQTGTFRMISHQEAKFVFRAVLMMSERIFAQYDPVAGSTEHRQILIDLMTRMLVK